jgi:hypothetical protein
LAIAVPPGFHIPEGYSITNDTLTVPTSSHEYRPLSLWAKAICHMHTYCMGATATNATNPLFRASEVRPAENAFPHVTFSDMFSIPFSTMPITHDEHAYAKATWDDARQKVIMAWYATQRPASSPSRPTNPNPTNPGSPELSELSKAIADGISLGTSSTNTSSTNKKEKDEIILQYRILFSRNGKKDEESAAEELIPANLSPRFLKFLDSSKKIQKKNLQEPFALFMSRMLKKDSNADQSVTLKYQQLDSPFATALTLFNWLACPLNRDRQSISSQLSMAHFLTVDDTDNLFKSRSAKERDATAQELVGEDVTKMNKKESTLFCSGRQRTPTDLKSAVFNLRALGKFITVM